MKKVIIKEKSTWTDTGGMRRIFHVYIGNKHKPEFCGVNYLDVKDRVKNLGDIEFVKDSNPPRFV